MALKYKKKKRKEKRRNMNQIGNKQQDGRFKLKNINYHSKCKWSKYQTKR